MFNFIYQIIEKISLIDKIIVFTFATENNKT